MTPGRAVRGRARIPPLATMGLATMGLITMGQAW